MSRVLPAEGDLRRVIGDGAAISGRRGRRARPPTSSSRSIANLVLLRTYDERSVVYHRQGRIGTYAIFWNHEAMQAGSVFALEDRDWIFPSYRESAIGLLRGIPASTILSLVARPSVRLVEPGGVQRRVDLRPDRRRTSRMRSGFAWGARLKGEDRVAIAYFGDGATSEGAVHEGATFAGVMKAPVDPLLQQQPVGDLDAGLGADGGADARRQGDRVRDARRARRRRRRARRVRGDARRGRCAPAPATARRSSRPSPIARRRTRPPTIPSIYIDQERVEEERENECVGRYERYLGRARRPLRRRRREEIKDEALELMRAGIAAAEAEPPADPSLVFEHAYADPPPGRRPTTSPSCGGSSVS